MFKTAYVKFSSSIEREERSNIELIFNEYFPEIKSVNSDYEKYDILFFLVASGGIEKQIKDLCLNNSLKDIIILTEGSNNSLAAGLETISYLQNNFSYERRLYYCDNNYKEDLQIIKTALELFEKTHGKNIGIFGGHSHWLTGSDYSEQNIKNILGLNIKNYTMDELIPGSKSAVNSKNEMEKAEEFHQFIIDKCKEDSIDFSTLKCFDFIDEINTTGCLSISKLNDEGIISSCEGDIPSLLSMIIADNFCNNPVFMANPSKIIMDENSVVFAHCTTPLRILEDYSWDTHFETGIGIAVKGKLKGKEFFILKINGELNDYRLFEGEKIDYEYNDLLCRTQIKLKLKNSVKKLFSNPIGNHMIIFEKNRSHESLKEYLDFIMNRVQELI